MTLALNKPAYIGICILELGEVLMYKFHYDYVKDKYGKTQEYYLQTLIVYCMKLKLKMSMKI